jgi:DnaK suppressor protein
MKPKIDLKHFERILREQSEQIAARIVEHQSPEEVENEILESEEHLLEKISTALERIVAGTYGQCAGCGGTIPLARLEAKPSVSLCLDCQSMKEREGK